MKIVLCGDEFDIFLFYASLQHIFSHSFLNQEYPISYLVMLFPFPQQKYKYGLSFPTPESYTGVISECLGYSLACVKGLIWD